MTDQTPKQDTEPHPSKPHPSSPQPTSDEIAAGGPIPGDLSLIAQELARSKEIASPGFSQQPTSWSPHDQSSQQQPWRTHRTSRR